MTDTLGLEIDDRLRTSGSERFVYVLRMKPSGEEIEFACHATAGRPGFTYAVNSILKKRGHDH